MYQVPLGRGFLGRGRIPRKASGRAITARPQPKRLPGFSFYRLRGGECLLVHLPVVGSVPSNNLAKKIL